MLIFDQLNKADRHLRVLSWIVATGLFVLLAGLWWVQVVRASHFSEAQSNQSYRTVRVPGPRGKILDRNGVVLAENRPVYNISLYLGDRSWRDLVNAEYRRRYEALRETKASMRLPNAFEHVLSWFGYKPSVVVYEPMKRDELTELKHTSRYVVTSNIVAQLSDVLGRQLVLNFRSFTNHYQRSRVLPLPICTNLAPAEIARVQERGLRLPGVDMEVQPIRVYPRGSLAAHALGYLRLSDESVEGELAYFDYRLPDFRGVSGLEYSLDNELRGHAGGKSVQINNLGYRQNETFWSSVEAGHDVMLTLDAEIQRVTEYELGRATGAHTPIRGAAVVLDCRTGEVIALASAPTFDPNKWIPGIAFEVFREYNNTNTTPLLNRAVYGGFAPGSTFKTVVALAGLEAGTLKPEEVYQSPGRYPIGPGIGDPAGAGPFDFKRAFKKSSNCYFIEQGLRVGRDPILSIAQRLHLGERTGIPLGQDSRGILPTREWVKQHRAPWMDGDTANLCIGQGDMLVTPLQMAVAIAAVANGGRVLTPQLVMATNSQNQIVDPTVRPVVHPNIRDQLPVSRRTLDIIHDAMLADTEDGDGTARLARVDGFRVCGKTGTAQLKRDRHVYDHVVWFASYAPYEDPRYVVVVMVQIGSPTGGSGGETCAPVAKKIYEELRKREQRPPARGNAFARN
jgi:penicillin-binding protein 2